MSKRHLLTRRRWTRLIGATGAVALAGCIGEEGEPDPPEDDGAGNGTGNGNGDVNGNGEIRSDTITVRATQLPEQINFNNWGSQPEWGGLDTWFQDLVEPYNVVTGDHLHSGHTWDVGGEEVSVPTLVADVEIDPPLHYTYEFDDRFTFWNGNPIDAEVYELHHYLGWLQDGNHFVEDEEFVWGIAEDDYRITFEIDEDEAQSELGFRQWITPAWENPLPAEFTRPWVEDFEDTTDEEDNDELASELSGQSIDLFELTENGWGAGPYEVLEDEITDTHLIAELREDHPAAENITIPKLEVQIAQDERYNQILGEGLVDTFDGVVQVADGQYNREVLPDHIQEVASFEVDSGDQLTFNWQNSHLERTNVRRAIVTAVPWNLVGDNGWGPEVSTPIEHDTGMLNTASRAWFGQEEYYPDDLLDQFYQYPIEADEELAATFMQEAGYERDGEEWIGPDGDVPELEFIVSSGIEQYAIAGLTIHNTLQDFGFRINFETIEDTSWLDRLENDAYDMTLIYSPGGLNPLLYYDNQDGATWIPLLFGSSGEWLCQEEDETDSQNRPLTVTVPEEIGELEIEGDGFTFNLCSDSRRLWEYGPDEEEIAEIAGRCARWYNYALPDYIFHQYNTGIGGNVRDFEWLRSDHEANWVEDKDYLHKYQIMSGLVSATGGE